MRNDTLIIHPDVIQRVGATWTCTSKILHQFFNVSAGYLRDCVMTLSFAPDVATATKTATGARNKARTEAVRVIFARDSLARAAMIAVQAFLSRPLSAESDATRCNGVETKNRFCTGNVVPEIATEARSPRPVISLIRTKVREQITIRALLADNYYRRG